VAISCTCRKNGGNDRKRLRKAGVPEEVGFKTKPEIALEQIAAACAAGLPRGVVLMDAAYGNNSDLRSDITALGLTYAAAFFPTPRYGLPARHRCQPRHGPAGAGHPSGCDVTPNIYRSRQGIALGLPNRSWRTIVCAKAARTSILALCSRASYCGTP